MGEVVTAGALAFDALLCLTLVFIAWRLIGMSDLFRAVMLFVVFGLLMSGCRPWTSLWRRRPSGRA